MAVERWDTLRPREVEDELTRAHALIYEKLPKRTKTLLALPEKERAKLIRERKKTWPRRKGWHKKTLGEARPTSAEMEPIPVFGRI